MLLREPVELGSLLAGQLLPQLAHKAGSEKRVHPPGLRQICTAELVMERIPVRVIRMQLGHASLHTTTVDLAYSAPVETRGHQVLAELEPLRAWQHPRYMR